MLSSRPQRSSFLLASLGLILGLAFLAGCQPALPEAPPVTDIVLRSADQMQSLAGFHFVIDRSGAPAYLDAAETLSFRRAEGDYVAPDQARANVRVIAPGLVAEVQVISIAQDYWETNVLTGQWHKLPADQGFNPAALFDPQTGIRPLLAEDLRELEYLGLQELAELPGQKLYTIRGQVSGNRLSAMSYGLIGQDQIQAQLWVAPQTFNLYRLQLVEQQPGAPEATTWQFDFWDFGEVVTIQPPPLQE